MSNSRKNPHRWTRLSAFQRLAIALSVGLGTLSACDDGGEPEGDDAAVPDESANLPAESDDDEFRVACGITVNTSRELMIRALGVVEDPARTVWNGNPDAPVNGAWHFGKLMTHMAGDQDASVFVRNWLQTWAQNRTINGEVVPSRTQINTIINNWPKLADGRLDLTRAPMRLLAIVNRVDLRGTQDAGEGRFVFGVLDSTGQPMQFTVILEYDLPLSVHSALGWAQAFHGLGALTPGTAAYNSALQAITDDFAGPDVLPARPNGSAISQVRTNEIALDFPWELREFALNATGRLVERTVSLTPRADLNNTNKLGRFVNANAAAILAGTHTVPLSFESQPFRAGAITNNIDFIDAPNITNNNARQRFSLNTCNGCHGAETSTTFLHVSPRAAGQVAALSGFLTGITVTDPGDGVTPRTFNDLGRRRTGMINLLCTAP